MQLEAMLAAAQDEIEERDKAIIELYEKYQEVVKEEDNEDDAKSISDNDSVPVDRAKIKKNKKLKSQKIQLENSDDKIQNENEEKNTNRNE